jgi:hypothetical protein
MKLLLSIIIITLSYSGAHSQSKSVFYGERDLASSQKNLYLDKEGLLYPPIFIPDSSMEASHSSLQEWYKKNESTFLEISRSYHCAFTSYTDENCFILNDSLFSSFISKTYPKEHSSATILIHGFRKPFKRVNRDTDSPLDFATLGKTCRKYNPQTIITEVYWDGLYDCCISASRKKNAPFFDLYAKAQLNAEKAGFSLNKIINRISYDTITIVSHSLGAKVALYALLDITNKGIKTPSNKRVNICLIAPAISPEMISDNYYKRNTSIDYKKSDNYSLAIVYNERDFVLLKRIAFIGPGPLKYGVTTLGCNYRNAAIKLEKNFHALYLASSIHLYDLSFIGKCHLVSCYCYSDNLKAVFEDFR